jgi:hypothetical protein
VREIGIAESTEAGTGCAQVLFELAEEHFLEHGSLLPAFINRDLTLVGLRRSTLMASYRMILSNNEGVHSLVRLSFQPVSICGLCTSRL